MENLSEDYELADVVCDEHSEILWDMINQVQNKREGSLLKLANKLVEDAKWTENTSPE